MNELEKLAREFGETIYTCGHSCYICTDHAELKKFIFGTFAMRLLEVVKTDGHRHLFISDLKEQCQRIAEEGEKF